jgi:uncharacterized protein YcnI
MKLVAPRNFLALVLFLLVGIPGAQAHVTLTAAEASANSFHKAVFQIPHGCEGSPTVAIRIQIPDGIIMVKPQPKPGWTISTDKTRVDPPLQGPHGERIAEVVKEVAWRGGSLPDDQYDEFALQMRLPPKAGVVLVFPVIQQCESGVNRWIERAQAGHHGHEVRRPAPQLRLR